jgi:hypothetical protein
MVAPVLVGFQDYHTNFLINNSKFRSYCTFLQQNADTYSAAMCV